MGGLRAVLCRKRLKFFSGTMSINRAHQWPAADSGVQVSVMHIKPFTFVLKLIDVELRLGRACKFSALLQETCSSLT